MNTVDIAANSEVDSKIFGNMSNRLLHGKSVRRFRASYFMKQRRRIHKRLTKAYKRDYERGMTPDSPYMPYWRG